MQVIEGIEVQESYSAASGSSSGREYLVRVNFVDPRKYPPDANLDYEEVRQRIRMALYTSLHSNLENIFSFESLLLSKKNQKHKHLTLLFDVSAIKALQVHCLP